MQVSVEISSRDELLKEILRSGWGRRVRIVLVLPQFQRGYSALLTSFLENRFLHHEAIDLRDN